jgi:hypothetical protein
MLLIMYFLLYSCNLCICRKRRRNWLAVQLRRQERQAELDRKGGKNESTEQQRIKRKLASHRNKYLAHKGTRAQPWGE